MAQAVAPADRRRAGGLLGRRAAGWSGGLVRGFRLFGRIRGFYRRRRLGGTGHAGLPLVSRTQSGGVRVGHGHGAAPLAGGRLDLFARLGGFLGLAGVAVAAGAVRGDLAVSLGLPAGLVGPALGLGALLGLFGRAPRFLGPAGFFGFLARLFRLAGLFDLLGDGRIQIRDQARQALVVAPELVGLGALGCDLPFKLGQQRGSLFLLPDQRGLLFGGFGDDLFDLGAPGVGTALQGSQAVDIRPQRLHGAGPGLGHVIQVAQVAAQHLGIVARQKRRPGRQAAGVLGAELVGQFDAALGQHGLLRADLFFQAGQVRLRLAVGIGQFLQAQVDLGDGRFRLLERIGRFLAGGLAAIDVLLQVLDAVAQGGLLLFGVGLASGEVVGRGASRQRPTGQHDRQQQPCRATHRDISPSWPCPGLPPQPWPPRSRRHRPDNSGGWGAGHHPIRRPGAGRSEYSG
ncbi:hypothetical protein D3C86_770960 [compost metagenome]